MGENESTGTEVCHYGGVVRIGDTEIVCGVTEDKTRLLSERGVCEALGLKRGGSHWLRQKEGSNLPVYASAENLYPFIDYRLYDRLTHPRLFRIAGQGGAGANGVEAAALPGICSVYLRARKDGKLTASQQHVADRAEVLLVALAETAIDALVDEATGYQAVRQRDELQRLLSKYIAEELQPWAKRFPDEFYRQIFRLRGWNWEALGGEHGKRPRIVGKLTNEIVYERLPAGVLDELRRRNPPDENGRRKHKHHQYLTEDIGDKNLEAQITADIALMRISKTWTGFMSYLDKAYPKKGVAQGELDIDPDELD
ncbi:P63C domain-containing protein [Bifidobacterium myosotis]|uniref:Bacteriophage Mx8 p63 C-terminal domain-containing protein n=1 Tax=Bifidobacterium myosotis TaxID=1630166 RepID=A0A5M9ZHX6_9BIFI|nr:P63C domain-containing protein [Bifidobacterium myosotis]KAA8827186.1 hypothetical protein EMO91_09035 [Bifidobacterium myosotis]